MRRILPTALVLTMLCSTLSCGYHLVGHGGQFPADVEEVAVPIFANSTRDTEIARRLTDHFIRELLATGKVRVVSSGEAQAVIRGTVTQYEFQPITFDADRRVTENRLFVAVDVSLVLKGQEQPVFSEKGVTRQYEYRVPEGLAQQQQEKDKAIESASRELSQRIITLMTEGF